MGAAGAGGGAQARHCVPFFVVAPWQSGLLHRRVID
jgi:hypothetical protein